METIDPAVTSGRPDAPGPDAVDGTVHGAALDTPGMDVFIPHVRHARADLHCLPLRVNLRYAPTSAHLTVRGDLVASQSAELTHVLAVLAQLPAAVEVDVREVDTVDDAGVDLLEHEQERRRREHAAPMWIRPSCARLRRGARTTPPADEGEQPCR